MISDKICFEPDELVNLSIMTKVPLAVVEGVDDVPLYQRLCTERSIEADVFASEMLIANREGCEGVKTNISQMRDTLPNFPIENYVVGILDRDARFFRNEIPADAAIFVLNSYSIENHYANSESVSYLVKQFTASGSISNELAVAIHQAIVNNISFIYYLTLDAIRNACERDYQSLVGFGNKIREVMGRRLHIEVMDRKQDLDRLAEDFGLVNDEATILTISKGKWLLELYFTELEKELKKLPAKCQVEEIPTCKVCASGLQKKCFYTTTSFVSGDILMQQSYMNTKLSNLNYIADRISSIPLTH